MIKRSLLLLALLPCWAFGADPGFTEDFSGAGNLGGFTSGASLGNPGTGGVGGDGDGFLSITRATAGQFAAATQAPQFTGNLTADGVTGFSLWLKDIGTPESFEIHIAVGTAGTNFWLYTPTFLPNQSWQQFYVDLTNPGLWSLVQGSGTFQAAIAASNRFHIRHDVAPFGFGGDTIAGDVGVDRITVVPEPSTVVVLGLLTVLTALRLRGSKPV